MILLLIKTILRLPSLNYQRATSPCQETVEGSVYTDNNLKYDTYTIIANLKQSQYISPDPCLQKNSHS